MWARKSPSLSRWICISVLFLSHKFLEAVSTDNQVDLILAHRHLEDEKLRQAAEFHTGHRRNEADLVLDKLAQLRRPLEIQHEVEEILVGDEASRPV